MELKYTLKTGDEGQEVKRLQKALKIGADGSFGPKTEQAVRDYQEDHRLVVDGLAGKRTLSSLDINVTAATDLSSWNGKVDFKKMKAAGCSIAWIKITEGTTHRNPGYQKKFDDARNAGFTVGAYHFGRPDTYAGDPKDWKKEADNFLQQLDVCGLECGDLVPVVDLEQGLKTDDNYNCEWYLNWLEYVGSKTSTRPVVYTARWAWQLYVMRANNNLQNQLASYPLWLASYNEGTSPDRVTKLWNKWDILQWTGSGSVPGVKGRCDQNWLAGGQLNKLRVP